MLSLADSIQSEGMVFRQLSPFNHLIETCIVQFQEHLLALPDGHSGPAASSSGPVRVELLHQ